MVKYVVQGIARVLVLKDLKVNVFKHVEGSQNFRYIRLTIDR